MPSRMKVALALLVALSLGGKSGSGDGRSIRPEVINQYKFLDISKINCTINSDGCFTDYRRTGTSGLEWPKGSGTTAVFSAGTWLIGRHRASGSLRTAVMDYGVEYQPGPLTETYNTSLNDDTGPVSRATDNKYRLYKISKSDLESGAPSNPDLTEWPGELGAPYVDVNGDGHWTPGVDQPKWYGDQQLFTVVNDVNKTRHTALGVTDPMGVEMRCLYYAYGQPGLLGNVMFMKWTIINKSDADYDSTFFGIWSDVDLGDANDDLPGCDTTQSLCYVYNDHNTDTKYGVAPPAVGYLLAQGPQVPGVPTDSALIDGVWRRGFTNLPMTAFVVFADVFPSITEGPPAGDVRFGSIAYDFMRGWAGDIHQVLVSPTSGMPMYRWFSGDPVTGSGDLPHNFPGGLFGAQDMRILMSAGPFTLARGDTQEVAAAFVISRGSSNLNSVSVLKQDASEIREFLMDGKPIASIVPLDTGNYTPTQRPAAVSASVRVVSGTVTGTEWSVVERPVGSTASIADPSALSTTITPDVPGLYIVQLVAVSSSGLKDTSTATFRAVNNRPPSVDFAMPAQMTLGDTLDIDFSAIHDEDGDTLTTQWTIDGGRYVPYVALSYGDSAMGMIVDSSATQLKYVPFRTSRFTIKARVSDRYYNVEASKEMVVVPLSSGTLQLHGRYSTAGLPAVGSYDFGRIMEFDNTVWASAYGSLFTPNFADNAFPAEAYAIQPGNYWVSGNRICVAGGASVDVFTTDTHRSIIAMNKVYSLALANVADVYYSAPVLLFSKGMLGLFAYDISDPASPVKLAQLKDGENWGNFAVNGDRLYALHPAANKMKIVDVSDPSNLAVTDSIMLGTGFTEIRLSGNLLQVFSPETLDVFDVGDPDHILRIMEMPVPHTCLPKNRFYDVCMYGDHLVAGTQEGLYDFDVADIAVPSVSGKYLTGYPHVRTYLDARRLVSAQWDRLNPGTAERLEGLLIFEPSYTGVREPMRLIPATSALEQNYPNPFNPTTSIGYSVGVVGLPAGQAGGQSSVVSSHVRLAVYDLLGREVAVLVDEVRNPGAYTAVWNAAGMASGVYFCRLRAGDFVQVRKLLLLQ
jgi:hypothetical protein